MKFAIASAVLSLATLARATTFFCPDASRFGILTVSPTNLSPGDEFTITHNLTCAVTQYDIVPTFLDYYIEVPENQNNGFELPILLARRTFKNSSHPVDEFKVKLPDAGYFTNAPYTVQVDVTYPINGSLSTPYFLVGGTEFGVNITDPNSV
ncbi:hypothetical protein SISSUDRAFT_1131387 [Sistotremastrum suecicum HHB10207 ss-3]|uniref:Uncharacterized protein n=1 Tax=Sistotremastrum suecicum HHB10207 ss-3 TaxID=1314776 RepID=A0A166A825_9AGAM|nr:hypothetical protein SISSUDRAFT_1131387 [Sistotremastrum suecicum HHB10207 ss-3]